MSLAGVRVGRCGICGSRCDGDRCRSCPPELEPDQWRTVDDPGDDGDNAAAATT